MEHGKLVTADTAATRGHTLRGELARLLSQRFGDGLVYLADSDDHRLLREAVASGLVSRDGQLTAAGYRILRRSSKD